MFVKIVLDLKVVIIAFVISIYFSFRLLYRGGKWRGWDCTSICTYISTTFALRPVLNNITKQKQNRSQEPLCFFRAQQVICKKIFNQVLSIFSNSVFFS